MDKSLINTFLVLLFPSISFLLPATSQAKPIIYDFKVEVTEGALQGNRFDGFFGYDDETITGKGREELGIEQGLIVCMNFLQKTYNETNDSNYPNFPKLILNDGEIEKLDFWIEEGKRVPWWNLAGWEVTARQRDTSEDITIICEQSL